MPARWEVIVLRDPEKVLVKLPRDLRHRLWTAIDSLGSNPRPAGCKKLRGYADLYRLRAGDWRITYAVQDDKLIVVVVEVAPRGGAYKGL